MYSTTLTSKSTDIGLVSISALGIEDGAETMTQKEKKKKKEEEENISSHSCSKLGIAFVSYRANTTYAVPDIVISPQLKVLEPYTSYPRTHYI